MQPPPNTEFKTRFFITKIKPQRYTPSIYRSERRTPLTEPSFRAMSHIRIPTILKSQCKSSSKYNTRNEHPELSHKHTII